MKRLRITIEGKQYEVDVEVIGEENAGSQAWPAMSSRSAASSAAAAPPASAPAPSSPPPAAALGDVVSPLAGTVVSVDVQEGAQVKAGDKLVTLEAMKMNTIVNAPSDGTIGAIYVKAGDPVEEGKPLVSLK
ncbi:biotin/lipoyl-containing protein [Pelagicoccus sp. SDUM812003]|uniref:biotin/lipoyl-containing protein n=1 Tax=Pelagicoccus sp. SDUM812003 TaxID=3041267 RepID=UPI00280F97D3|nr:biotin/lipoyl-containing protein [Pelagicoccus sp. SDUM812003]MDQ8203806.1 biotin/lipoyl-binding protein [Pelagicoccus sp. SDUM812003]